MKDKKALGKFIQEKRKSVGLSQKDIAERLYVTESAVSKWERGVSYPDITMITGICEALGISEHELCIASEDHKQHEIEKMAKNFTSIKKIYSWILYLCYAGALIPCFICNIVFDHKLSWFFIVLTSLMLTFSLLNVPVLVKSHKSIITLASCYISLILLLISCRLFVGGDWFIMTVLSITFGLVLIFLPIILYRENIGLYFGKNKGLLCMAVDTVMVLAVVLYGTFHYGNPANTKIGLLSTIFGLIPTWIIFAVIRYPKFNSFFKTSICLAVTGIYTAITNQVINNFIYNRKTTLNNLWNSLGDIEMANAITAISILGLSLIFAIVGIIYSVSSHKNTAL